MSSNVERLRALFARFNETGELDFSVAHPDLELHDRPDVPDGRVWRGIDGVRRPCGGKSAARAVEFDPALASGG